MTEPIRPVPEADLRTWRDSVNVAFGEETNSEEWGLDRIVLEPDRVLGAYDGDAIVGGGACFSMKLTVPVGQQVAAAGVTAVGIMPTHRRQGLLRRLMARQLEDARSRGDVVAILWATEGGIYQRFGYGLGSVNAALDLDRERAVFRSPVVATGEGAVRLVDPTEASRLMPPVFDTVAAQTPGFYARSPAWWKYLLADPEYRRRGFSHRFHALYERDGAILGYTMYRIKQEWGDFGPGGVLQVIEVVGTDAAATQQLWRFLFGIDLITRIRMRLGPTDHPLLLMLAEPRRMALRMGDGLWLRVLDVATAMQTRTYLADGSLVLQVDDEFMPAVGGRWRMTVEGGRATVVATDEPADLVIDIADLGAAYLGAFSFESLGRAGRTKELTAQARRRADAIFASPITPWCPEIF